MFLHHRVELERLPRRPASSVAMAPKPRLLPTGAVAKSTWMQETEARLLAQAKAIGKGKPSLAAFVGAHTSEVTEIEPNEPVALGRMPGMPMRSTEEAMLLLHRRGTGVLKTGFEPQRHSVIIAGRPVQVLSFVMFMLSCA